MRRPVLVTAHAQKTLMAQHAGPHDVRAGIVVLGLGLDEDNIEDAIAEMIPTLRENKGEPFGSFKKLTMEDAAEIYRLAL